jgi:hypothetical protein
MKKLLKSFIPLLSIIPIVGVFSCIPPNAADRVPVMAVLGDSISAAAFAHTPHPRLDPSDEVNEANDTPENPLNPFRYLLENKKTLSWASGDEIQSHYLKLKTFLASKSPSEKVDVINLSESGAEVNNVERQSESLKFIIKSGF